jgi:hypothetical protein
MRDGWKAGAQVNAAGLGVKEVMNKNPYCEGAAHTGIGGWDLWTAIQDTNGWCKRMQQKRVAAGPLQRHFLNGIVCALGMD